MSQYNVRLYDPTQPDAIPAPTSTTADAATGIPLATASTASVQVDAAVATAVPLRTAAAVSVLVDASAVTTIPLRTVAAASVKVDASAVTGATLLTAATASVKVDASGVTAISLRTVAAASIKVDASAVSATSLRTNAAASVKVDATSATAIPLRTTAVEEVDVHAAESSSFTIGTHASALVQVDAAATTGIPLRTAATGSVQISATSTKPVPLSTAAAVSLRIGVASTTGVPVRTAATAAVQVDAVATETVPLRTGAHASVPVDATAVTEIPLDTTAAATVGGADHIDETAAVPLGTQATLSVQVTSDSNTGIPLGVVAAGSVQVAAETSTPVPINTDASYSGQVEVVVSSSTVVSLATTATVTVGAVGERPVVTGGGMRRGAWERWMAWKERFFPWRKPAPPVVPLLGAAVPVPVVLFPVFERSTATVLLRPKLVLLPAREQVKQVPVAPLLQTPLGGPQKGSSRVSRPRLKRVANLLAPEPSAPTIPKAPVTLRLRPEPVQEGAGLAACSLQLIAGAKDTVHAAAAQELVVSQVRPWLKHNQGADRSRATVVLAVVILPAPVQVQVENAAPDVVSSVALDNMVRRIMARFGKQIGAAWLAAIHEHQGQLPMRRLEDALQHNDYAEAKRLLGVGKLRKELAVALVPVLLQVIRAAGEGSARVLRASGVAAPFDPTQTNVTMVAKRLANDLVDTAAAGIAKAIPSVSGLSAAIALTPAQQAIALREVLGLPANWAAAPQRLAEEILTGKKAAATSRKLAAVDRRAIERRMDAGTVDRAFAEEMATRYAKSLIKFRAETIARTEAQRAAHEGLMENWRQGVVAGVLPRNVRRIWIVTEDDKLCPICRRIPGMNPQGRGLTEPFTTPEGLVMAPPAPHPRCRCTIGMKFPKQSTRRKAS